jgi:hypothetical protein
VNDAGSLLSTIGKGFLLLLLIMAALPFLTLSIGMSSIDAQLSNAFKNEPVVVGMSNAEAKARKASLSRLLAPPSAIRGTALRVTVLGVSFDRRNRERTEAAETANARSGIATAAMRDALAKPHALTIDFSTVTRNGAVLLTNESVALKVTGASPANAQAMFAIESPLFPVVDDIAPGILAGFKIGKVRSRGAAAPIDPFDPEAENRGQLCNSLRAWSEHYGVGIASMRYVLFKDPREIYFDGAAWTSDGNTVAILDQTDIARLCF